MGSHSVISTVIAFHISLLIHRVRVSLTNQKLGFQNPTLKQEQNCNYCFNVNVLVIVINNNVLYVCIMHLNPVIYSNSSKYNLEKRPEIIKFSETINKRNGYFAT